jgi:outer membrane protein OmpA-like peptidoglycan-associated protein
MKYRYLLFGGLFVALLSFTASVQTPVRLYKTIYDTAFEPGNIIHFTPVRFQLGKCVLQQDSSMDDSLRKVAEFITAHPTFTFRVRNHSDTVIAKSSTKRTMCRAESVLNRLVLLGADPRRLTVYGMGDHEPLKTERTVYLPSGDSVPAGTLLTRKFIYSNNRSKPDCEFLKMQNRRTDLKIDRTDYRDTTQR